MVPVSSAQDLYDRVIVGGGDEDEHYRLAGWLSDTGRLLSAFHVLDLAADRFGGGHQLEASLTAAFATLESSGGVEGLMPTLPDPVAMAFSVERERALADHGPGSPRPASRELVLCVALKNLFTRFRDLFPGALALLRICDCYGRVSAEQSWGNRCGDVMVKEGVASVTVGGRTLFYAARRNERRDWLYFFILKPGLVRWVARFAPQDVFLDIGANVGRFSVLAAAAAGCRTISVEPFTVNFNALRQNIALNGLWERVTPLQAAIRDVTGAAAQRFSNVAGPVDGNVEHLEGYRLDDLVAADRIPVPNHIKIDVDGGEFRLIDGMAETLKDHRLRSIRLQIRLDEEASPAALDRIRAAGFDCAIDDDSKNYLCLRA